MRRRGFALLCLAAAAGFAALGVWQVERRAWKLALIARVDARVHAPAGPLPPRSQWGDIAYRHVRVSGRFLPGATTRVKAVTEFGSGYWVMTPLVTPAGTLLVNRGFVPDEPTVAASASGEATVTGLLRKSEPGGGFLRANDPAHERWYSRDVAAIARARGLRDALPFFLDADATPQPGGYPVGGLTVTTFRNAHLAYALTWFALSALSLWGARRVWRRERG